MLKMSIKNGILLILICLLNACGFHVRGEMELAQPLHRLYLEASDPYSYLVRTLKKYLKTSHVELTQTPELAQTKLVIVSDVPVQQLLSVSGTQQTRQYILSVTVTFEIQDKAGRIIVGPEPLVEQRVITVQSNQILGASNEANLFYQQMRRALAFALMNRISSREVTKKIIDSFRTPLPPTTTP